MSSSYRNAPCWCGSGKKYKSCHLNREGQEPPSLWKMQAEFRGLHKAKLCLHPEASDSTCRGGIIRSHTVRRSADLKAIARDGHVYQVGRIDFAALNKTAGRITPHLIGINEASTFLGFCQAHDSSTFAPLEIQAFGPTDEQAFLLAYRPLVKELYLKKRQLETNELAKNADKGKRFEDQYAIQEMLYLHGKGIRSAIYDLDNHKAIFDADLLRRDFNGIRYVAIHFDGVPDIMCSGAVQPSHSFSGSLIQNVADIEKVLEQITFSLLATNSGGAGVFAWHATSDAASSALVDSLLAAPEADIPAAIVRFALSEFENVFLRPAWWEDLDRGAQRSLEARINLNVSPFEEPDSLRLRDDGIRPVAWRVTRVEQKRA